MYTGSYESDARVSPQCTNTLSTTSSLPQGETFAKMTSTFHGGRMRRMRGGSASYPGSFQEVLPTSLHGQANISSLDSAFAQLPEYAGKYGMSGGKRKNTRKMRGGVAPVNAPAMILSPGEEPAAFLNPQWYTENQVVPSFKGPDNAYVQKAGRRHRKASRKMNRDRKASRKMNRKASRKNRH